MPRYGKLVHRHIAFLRALRSTRSPKKLHRLISRAKRSELLALVEIALNVLSPRSILQLHERQRLPLYPHAPQIRRIGRARSEEGARRALQKGGAIPGLIPALLAPVLAEITKSLLFSK
jgi:hypothetical protein